jgi:hypothetical protein
MNANRVRVEFTLRASRGASSMNDSAQNTDDYAEELL